MYSLTHKQQQEAVERIQALIGNGISSREAIDLVSSELRANYTPAQESPHSGRARR
ncbi:YoaH family protein [secondary endosymbiont of Ctenarytaina eucalypti]|uniref:Uncharacterized protein n=1 Tax=secondary endosymbiont of Ctenarytaina eucalypti TaxID=1199245 RepID=J3TF21_9ENTR|nr:YoaH family protein [secondary endosymbiont of Ctenarytaina eucalypti]AFP84612.1 hypothetical protein A359_02110 [secondary endosymbiont of Ctenarytaina eucalypti]